MATIQKRGDKYRVLIRKAGQPTVTKTFSKLALAKQYANQTEASMEADTYRADTAKFGDVIKDATKTLDFSEGKTKNYRRLDILMGEMSLKDVTADWLMDYALQRRPLVKPSTIQNDFAYIRTILKYAENKMNLRPDMAGFNRAQSWLTSEKILQQSEHRDRRVTDQEMQLIAAQQTTGYVNLAEMMRFAVLTAMRRGEQFNLLWDELNEDDRTIGVWRKHPRRGKVYSRVPLLKESLDIILKQPRFKRKGRIFTHTDNRVGEVFRECAEKAGVKDIRWHDLRHEGCSRLHELGLDSMTVSLFSGHRDIQMLMRYTHLRAETVVEKLKENNL